LQVNTGVDEFLFNLAILGSVQHSDGRVWQKQHTHYYIVECMPSILDKDKVGNASIGKQYSQVCCWI